MSYFNLEQYPLFTALVTPFTAEGDVAYDDLLTLLKRQEAAKNGVLILGSTGEALNLSMAVRKQIVDFCLAQNLKVPMMVGVGGILLEDTLAWVEWLTTKPIDSLLMVTPLYSKPGRYGQTQWFRKLLDATDKPTVLYNIPGRTAVSLDLDTVKDLIDHPNFYGIKEASGSVEKYRQYQAAAVGKFMYCGDDALMPEFSQAGARGLISVASNVWPEATHAYVKQNLDKTFTDAELWQRASKALFLASNPIPTKCILAENMVIQAAYLQPPLNEQDLADLSPLIALDNLIKTWFKRQA